MTTTDPAQEEFTARLSAVRASRRQRAPMLLGAVLAPFGLALIGLAWLGASHTPVVQEQLSYLISGGLLGMGLVVVGGFLYFTHWQSQQVHETRSQTREVVAALEGMQTTLDRLAAHLASRPHLVMTPRGTISHLPDCSVVTGRTDLLAAAGDVTGCRICQPA